MLCDAGGFEGAGGGQLETGDCGSTSDGRKRPFWNLCAASSACNSVSRWGNRSCSFWQKKTESIEKWVEKRKRKEIFFFF